MSKITNIEGDIDNAQSLKQWHKLFGTLPPKYLSPRLRDAVLAWEVQARAKGGLSRQVKSALRGPNKVQNAIPTNDLKAGVTLVREWNGRAYQVSVLEKGFLMDGKNYTSLSAIANKITGAKWSGPRFFGLNTKKGAKHA